MLNFSLFGFHFTTFSFLIWIKFIFNNNLFIRYIFENLYKITILFIFLRSGLKTFINRNETYFPTNFLYYLELFTTYPNALFYHCKLSLGL